MYCLNTKLTIDSLYKVSQLNLDKSLLEWITDYLTHRVRQQTVIANNYKSLIINIKQEIPQGSMLGLLLYFIYANDLQRMITKCHADDMVLYSMSGNFVAAKQT